MPQLVSSIAQVISNIRSYNAGVVSNDQLAGRIQQHPAWYAIEVGGRWMFGPSKYVGYAGVTPDDYVATAYDRRTGTETEPALKQWFTEVDAASALGRELRAAFDAFAGARGKRANARWRVSIPTDELAARGARQPGGDLLERIAFNPDILGGRPHIRDTRVGVGHILAALAAGDTAEQIVDELPWLTLEDVRAALMFAAQTINHPILVAA